MLSICYSVADVVHILILRVGAFQRLRWSGCFSAGRVKLQLRWHQKFLIPYYLADLL